MCSSVVCICRLSGFSQCSVMCWRFWFLCLCVSVCMCFYACADTFVYMRTCWWVLGRLQVLVGLIERDHCQRDWSGGRLSWNTNTHRNTGCLSHTTEMSRLILFLFSSRVFFVLRPFPLSFSSSTLSLIFINPLLWCLASCPCALSPVDWPWWCHGHHENVSLMLD